MNGQPHRNERLFADDLAADIARAKYAESVTLLYGDHESASLLLPPLLRQARQAAERADRIGQLAAAVRIMAVRYGDARAQLVRAGAAWPPDAEANGAAVRAIRRRHQALMRLTRALVTYAITAP